MQWEPVPQEFIHGIITRYAILYRDEKETKVKDVPASRKKAVVNGLRQSTTYSFRVLAATVKGNGPGSEPKFTTTGGREWVRAVEPSRFPKSFSDDKYIIIEL